MTARRTASAVMPHAGGDPRWARALCVALLVLFAVVLCRTAWVCDDAYISLRTIDNLVQGYGLRWNVAERVQSYTHPLWLALLATVYAFTHEAFYTTLLLSIAVSLACALVLGFGLKAAPWAAACGLTTTLLSRAFVDYSTSGLENPLTHLLLLLFVRELSEDEIDSRRLLWLGSIACAAALNRIDAVLMFAPALAVATIRQGKRKGLAFAAAGFLPLLLWEGFSVFYYGIPYPNTALAKLNTGIAAGELARQGVHYLVNSLRSDPATLFVIFAGIAAAAVRRTWRELALAVGVVLYLAYVVRIGGDFMSGRFLSAPFLASVAILVRTDFLSWRIAKPIYLAVILVLGFLSPHPTLTSGRDFGMDQEELIDERGIADERRVYFNISGVFNGDPRWTRPAPWVTEEGRQAKRGAAPVLALGAIGFESYSAGPRVHVLDYHALADPLLSRLPIVERDPLYDVVYGKLRQGDKPAQGWRIGHFLRTVPPGYLATLAAGENRIADRKLAELYDHLTVVARGPLLSHKRLATIVQLNLGAYRDRVDARAAQYRPIDWNEVIAVRPDHAEGHYQRGKQRRQYGELGQALADLERAIALEPRHALALAEAAEILRELDQPNRAIEYARRAIEIDPDDSTPRMTLGTLLCLSGDYEQGIQHFAAAAVLDRGLTAAAYSNIGLAYANMGRHAEALDWLAKSLALDPRDASSHYNLGFTLLEQGKTAEAIARLEKALELDPSLEIAAIDAAKAQVMSGQMPRARETLERFLAANPLSAETHFRLGQLLLVSGDRGPAVEHVRRSAGLGFQPARQFLQQHGLGE